MLTAASREHRGWEMNMLATVYPLLLFTSNAIWTSTTSITEPLTDYYHITSSVESEFPNLIFSAVFLIVGPVTPWITDRLGVMRTMALSAVVMTLGSLCRALSGLGFFWLMLGNGLVSLVQALITSNMSALAILCVGTTQQGMYIGVASVIGAIGTAWGFAVSSWLIQSASEYGTYFPRIELVYLTMNVLCTGALCTVCYRRWQRRRARAARHVAGSADGAAGAAGTTVDDDNDHAYFASMQFPMENSWKVIAATIAVSLLSAAGNAITIVLEQILLNLGYGSSQVFTSGVLYLVPCIIFPLPFGVLVDWCEHETVLSVLLYGSTAVLQVAVLYSGLSLQAFYVLLTFYGINTTVISTVFLPIANRWSNGHYVKEINTVYSWLNTFVTLILTLVLTILPTNIATAVFAVIAGVCLLLTLALFCCYTP